MEKKKNCWIELLCASFYFIISFRRLFLDFDEHNPYSFLLYNEFLNSLLMWFILFHQIFFKRFFHIYYFCIQWKYEIQPDFDGHKHNPYIFILYIEYLNSFLMWFILFHNFFLKRSFTYISICLLSMFYFYNFKNIFQIKCFRIIIIKYA